MSCSRTTHRLYVPSLSLQEAALAEANGAAGAPDREPIYNREALAEALEDIAWPAGVSWTEAQAVTSAEPTAIADVEDDLTRELAFYNQASRGTPSHHLSLRPCKTARTKMIAAITGHGLA